MTEKGEHRDDTQDQGTVRHATGRGAILGRNPEQEVWTGPRPMSAEHSTTEQCQLDSAAMHTGVPKDEMRNMLVSGWAPAGRTPWSRSGKAEWSLNDGEGSPRAAGVQVT